MPTPTPGFEVECTAPSITHGGGLRGGGDLPSCIFLPSLGGPPTARPPTRPRRCPAACLAVTQDSRLALPMPTVWPGTTDFVKEPAPWSTMMTDAMPPSTACAAIARAWNATGFDAAWLARFSGDKHRYMSPAGALLAFGVAHVPHAYAIADVDASREGWSGTFLGQLWKQTEMRLASTCRRQPRRERADVTTAASCRIQAADQFLARARAHSRVVPVVGRQVRR